MDVASPSVLLRLETQSHDIFELWSTIVGSLVSAQCDVRKRKAKCATRNCHPSVTYNPSTHQLFISTF